MLQPAAGVAGGAAKAGLGGAAGTGSGVYMLNELLRSTLWQTKSAASQVNLANALASGSADAVVDVLLKMGTAQVGESR